MIVKKWYIDRRLTIGQLDGTSPSFSAFDWSDPHFLIAEPTILPLPFKVEHIAFGDKHIILLDSDNLVWEMRSFGVVSIIYLPSVILLL